MDFETYYGVIRKTKSNNNKDAFTVGTIRNMKIFVDIRYINRVSEGEVWRGVIFKPEGKSYYVFEPKEKYDPVVKETVDKFGVYLYKKYPTVENGRMLSEKSWKKEKLDFCSKKDYETLGAPQWLQIDPKVLNYLWELSEKWQVDQTKYFQDNPEEFEKAS